MCGGVLWQLYRQCIIFIVRMRGCMLIVRSRKWRGGVLVLALLWLLSGLFQRLKRALHPKLQPHLTRELLHPFLHRSAKRRFLSCVLVAHISSH